MNATPHLIGYSTVGGAEIRYDRLSRAAYGTPGVGPRTVRSTPEFRVKLEAALKDLEGLTGSPLLYLVSGGFHVVKAGRHAEGRACDLDALFWPEASGIAPLVTLQAPEDTCRYLAVEAVLRRHFGTVLNYWYNASHRDHWHVDDAGPLGWYAGSRSRAVFVQAACRFIHGPTLQIDGVCGPATLAALRHLLCEPMGAGDSPEWRAFLHLTAQRGWRMGMAR